MTMEVGDWDVRAALLQGRGQRIRRYMIYADESLMQSILKVQQETGKPVTRAIVLADSGGLNLHQQMCPMCTYMNIRALQAFNIFLSCIVQRSN